MCVLCATSLSADQHICGKCGSAIYADLVAILDLACEAHLQATHKVGQGQGRSVPGSKPPLAVDALDPELTLIRLVSDDPSSDVPLLVVLEDWERIIREERHLAPYGVASEARSAQAGAHTSATLTSVVGFLQSHHAWCMDEPTFDVAEYARQVYLCRRALARWDQDAEPPGWRVPCPTVADDGECGYTLKVGRGVEHIRCRRCGRDWELPRLLAVAGQDADVWVDVEAAATLAGIHERTIRKWVSKGAVRKQGQLVRVLDVRRHVHAMTAS